MNPEAARAIGSLALFIGGLDRVPGREDALEDLLVLKEQLEVREGQVTVPSQELLDLLKRLEELVTHVVEMDLEVAVQVTLLDLRDACSNLVERLD